MILYDQKTYFASDEHLYQKKKKKNEIAYFKAVLWSFHANDLPFFEQGFLSFTIISI